MPASHVYICVAGEGEGKDGGGETLNCHLWMEAGEVYAFPTVCFFLFFLFT